MIGDIERQRLATLEAHYDNLDEYTREHITNIYDQIADTDKTINDFAKELEGVEKEVRNLK